MSSCIAAACTVQFVLFEILKVNDDKVVLEILKDQCDALVILNEKCEPIYANKLAVDLLKYEADLPKLKLLQNGKNSTFKQIIKKM